MKKNENNKPKNNEKIKKETEKIKEIIRKDNRQCRSDRSPKNQYNSSCRADHCFG